MADWYRMHSRWQIAAAGSLVMAMLMPATEAAACSRTITVAISPVGRAMMVGTDGKVTGAVAEFLNKVSTESSCKFDYRIVPRARALMLLAAGEVDIVPAATQSPERDYHGRLIPTHRLRLSAVSFDPRRSGLLSTDMLLRQKLHIGVVRAYDFGRGYADLMGKLKQNGRLHEVTDPAGLIGLLNSGRIDAAVIPLPAIADAVEDSGMGGRLRSWTLEDVSQSQIGFYVSSTSLGEPDQSKLHLALKRAVASGMYKQLMQRHYPEWSLAGVVFD